MVDFQSRDRQTRGRDDEDEDPSGADPSADPDSDDDDSTTRSTDDETGAPTPSTGVAVVTIADDRTVDTDSVGDAVVEALDGHDLVTRELLGRSHDSVQAAVDALVKRSDVDAVVTVGGTGVGSRDVTIEAVHPLFEKALPGFGELFRRRSEAEIGTRIVATRATAGIAGGVPVFCLPGSESAVRLGVEEVVFPEMGHLVDLAVRDRTDEE